MPQSPTAEPAIFYLSPKMRRRYRLAAYAASPSDETLAFAVATEDNFVAVLEKISRLAVGQANGLRAVTCQLEKAPAFIPGRTGNCTGGEQVSWSKIAAVAGVMGHHLRHCPIKVLHVRSAEPRVSLF